MDNNESLVAYTEADEIDLYELWLTVKKRLKLISIVILITILLVTIYIILTPTIYKTSFVLQTKSDIVSPFQIKQNINNITKLVKNKEYSTLKQKLNFNNIKTIKVISANIPKGEKDLVLITLEVTSTKVIDNFVNKLLNYLNSRPSIKKEIEIQKKQLKATIAILKKQIKNLGNLQRELNSNSTFINSLSIQIDPLQVALSIQQDREKIIEIQAELNDLQAVKLVVQPIIPQKPYWPKTSLLLIVAFIGGLFISIFIAFFIEWIEEAKKRFEKNNNEQ